MLVTRSMLSMLSRAAMFPPLLHAACCLVHTSWLMPQRSCQRCGWNRLHCIEATRWRCCAASSKGSVHAVHPNSMLMCAVSMAPPLTAINGNVNVQVRLPKRERPPHLQSGGQSARLQRHEPRNRVQRDRCTRAIRSHHERDSAAAATGELRRSGRVFRSRSQSLSDDPSLRLCDTVDVERGRHRVEPRRYVAHIARSL